MSRRESSIYTVWGPGTLPDGTEPGQENRRTVRQGGTEMTEGQAVKILRLPLRMVPSQSAGATRLRKRIPGLIAGDGA